MPTVEQVVRARHEAGHSQRAIARELNIDRRKVKRMIDKWLDNVRAIEASPVHLVRGYRSSALVSIAMPSLRQLSGPATRRARHHEMGAWCGKEKQPAQLR